jgi:large-conductance mechanosensitive channel
VPIEYIVILKDGIYFFKGEFARAKDAILNYTNFISIVNTINIARIIFIRIKLGRLSNFKD